MTPRAFDFDDGASLPKRNPDPPVTLPQMLAVTQSDLTRAKLRRAILDGLEQLKPSCGDLFKRMYGSVWMSTLPEVVFGMTDLQLKRALEQVEASLAKPNLRL